MHPIETALKRLCLVMQQLRETTQFDTMDWRRVDKHLSAELIRLAGNHFCETPAALITGRIGNRRRVKNPTNRQKQEARRLLREAVMDGRLPKSPFCENCGNKFPSYMIHGHHVDYNKPYAVRWLCIRCHNEQHTDKFQRYTVVKPPKQNNIK